MLLPRLRSILLLACVSALLAGGSALGFARWTRPFLEGDRALAAGDRETALARYAAAELRLRRLPLGRVLFADAYARTIYNQLALLYRAGKFDAVIDKAASAPSVARPHFWAGSALFERALIQQTPDTRLAALSRAQDELRLALAASPDDWNTKYNYELAARLANDLRREPGKPPATLMHLLRPQPAPRRPVRKVG